VYSSRQVAIQSCHIVKILI